MPNSLNLPESVQWAVRSRKQHHRYVLGLNIASLVGSFLSVVFFLSLASVLENDALVFVAFLSFPSVWGISFFLTGRVKRRHLQQLVQVAYDRNRSDTRFLEKGSSPKRRSPRQYLRLIHALGWLTAGIVSVVVTADVGTEGAIFFRVMLATAGPLIAVYVYTRRDYVRKGAKEVLALDPRPPVMILRSFQEDYLFENPLASVASLIGPVIAIGRPGEGLPDTGAARVYVSDENWQEFVSEAITKCSLVIIVVSESSGLQWEEALVLLQLPPDKLLFFFPQKRTVPWLFRVLTRQPSERESRYLEFRRRVADKLPHELPSELGDGMFLSFSEEWKPQVIGPGREGLKRFVSTSADAEFHCLLPFIWERHFVPYVTETFQNELIQKFVILSCGANMTFVRIVDSILALQHPLRRMFSLSARVSVLVIGAFLLAFMFVLHQSENAETTAEGITSVVLSMLLVGYFAKTFLMPMVRELGNEFKLLAAYRNEVSPKTR